MSKRLHVVFKVADSEYVVAAQDVLHMESFTGATRVPGTQEHVIGLMQIRQRVVPIIDMRARFGVPPAPATLESRVVVIHSEERAIGLLVDSAREVIELAADAFSAPPDVISKRSHGFVSALAKANERLVMLIDLPKIIGEEALSG
jgi:purine-binding chemotaxis protein CheW